MTELSRFYLDWWLRFAVAGGALLLIGWLVVSLSRQPAKRLSAGFWTLVIALGVIPLTLLPGWLPLPWQSPFTTKDQQIVQKPTKGNVAAATASPDHAEIAPENSSHLDDEWFQEVPDGSNVGQLGVLPDSDRSLPVKPPTRQTPLVTQHAEEQAPYQLGQSWWIGIVDFALVGYGIVVLCLFARLIVGQLGLIRLWRSGRAVPKEIGNLFAQMTQHLSQQPEVRVSDRLTGPICFGVIRPRIMLPVALNHASDEKPLRWIFAHELSHVQRNDPLTGWLLGFVQALYFFCPWFWWLRRSIRLSQEFLADGAAIDDCRSKNSPLASSATDYADFLVRMASCRAIPIGAAGVRGTSSDLFRRITMLVQRSEKMEGNCSRRWSLLAGGGLLTLGIALAGFYLPGNLLTAAQAPEKKDAKKAEPAKPADPDDDDAVRKAIEELKKGPAPRDKDKDEPKDPPRVEPRPVDPRGGDPFADIQRQQAEMMKRLMEQMQRQGGGQPGNLEDVQKMVDEMMKQMQGQQLRPLGPNFFPFPDLPGMGMGGRGGMRGGRIDRQGRPTAMNGDVRMGIRIEKPSSVLVEQLDLPREKGMVVSDVRADSVADKAGIRINDILMEIDGKAVPSEPLDFVRMVLEIKAETPVDVTVLRKGRKETLKGMKLPEIARQPQRPALQPFPGFRPQGQGGFVFPQIQDLPRAAEAISGMSVSRNNDEFTVTFNANDLKGKITGIVVEGKAVVSDIEINDNGQTIKAKAVEKLDPKYQKLVEKMISAIR